MVNKPVKSNCDNEVEQNKGYLELYQYPSGVAFPFDVCYLANTRCLDPFPRSFYKMEDEEVFITIYPNGSVEGRIITQECKRDTYFQSHPMWDERIKKIRILKDIKGPNQLFGIIVRLGFKLTRFIEEVSYGKERTELRRTIEKLNESSSPIPGTKEVLAVTNPTSKQEEKKIFFMYNDFLDCQDNPDRVYYFTAREDIEPFLNIEPFLKIHNHSFNPDYWQSSYYEPINRSLEEAIKVANKMYSSPYKMEPPEKSLNFLSRDLDECNEILEGMIPKTLRVLFGLPEPPDIEYIENEYIDDEKTELSDKINVLQDINRQLRNLKS